MKQALPMEIFRFFSTICQLVILLWLVAASIFCGISVLLYLKLKSGESPFHFLKIVKGSLLTAFATASSMAACQKALDEFTKRTACDSKSVGITFPVSLVFCKPASAAYRVLQIYFAAYISGINIGVEMWPMLILISFVTTISIPPVVGGGITILPLILTPFGIPLNCVPLLVIIDAITDNFITAANFLSAQVLTWSESVFVSNKKNQ